MSTYTVATGRWNNYSNNGSLVDSLTLDVRTAALLIAATATFITIVGARFWSILSYSIFQIRASQYNRDGVHHQQQAIYRTSSQLGTVWMLMKIVWGWRNTAHYNLLRFILFALPPLVSFAGFTAAGILSSRIAAPNYAASDVRIKPQNCGVTAYIQSADPRYDALRGTILFSKYTAAKARLATDYARRCYTNVTSTPAGCSIYPSQKLPYRTATNAPCPFGGNRCWLGEEGAMRMTTEWLDSHKHLGINAQPKHRIHFQRVTTCSVLKIDDLVNATSSSTGDVYSYFLGSRTETADASGPPSPTYQWRESTRFDSIGYNLA